MGFADRSVRAARGAKIWNQAMTCLLYTSVVSVNTDLGVQAFSLDIYGQVDGAQIEWFESLQKKFQMCIRDSLCAAGKQYVFRNSGR